MRALILKNVLTVIQTFRYSILFGAQQTRAATQNARTQTLLFSLLQAAPSRPACLPSYLYCPLVASLDVQGGCLFQRGKEDGEVGLVFAVDLEEREDNSISLSSSGADGVSAPRGICFIADRLLIVTVNASATLPSCSIHYLRCTALTLSPWFAAVLRALSVKLIPKTISRVTASSSVRYQFQFAPLLDPTAPSRSSCSWLHSTFETDSAALPKYS